jgi:LysR family transcriptional regulator, glycine cleavage system transcriptional activator
LTQAGARLFPVVRDGLEAFAATLGAIRRHGDRAPLRVTTTNAFASRWLVPRLARWRKLRRDAPLDVIGTDNVIDLRAGDADVAIRYGRTPPRDGRAEQFLQDTFWPVCSPQLVAAGGRLPARSQAACPGPLLLVAVRSRSPDLAAMALVRARQGARRP